MWVFDIIKSVPSGAADATASVPMMAPAPGRFSITKGRFSASDRCWPTRGHRHRPAAGAERHDDGHVAAG